MIELVAQEGLALDVASGGELAAARAAGFAPADIFFHGNNKTSAELELGLDYGIGYVVVDSLSEIAALDAAAARRGVVAAGAGAYHAGRQAGHPQRPCRPASPTPSSASA